MLSLSLSITLTPAATSMQHTVCCFAAAALCSAVWPLRSTEKGDTNQNSHTFNLIGNRGNRRQIPTDQAQCTAFKETFHRWLLHGKLEVKGKELVVCILYGTQRSDIRQVLSLLISAWLGCDHRIQRSENGVRSEGAAEATQTTAPDWPSPGLQPTRSREKRNRQRGRAFLWRTKKEKKTHLSLSIMLSRAPEAEDSRYLTTSRWPWRAAQCSAVWPWASMESSEKPDACRSRSRFKSPSLAARTTLVDAFSSNGLVREGKMFKKNTRRRYRKPLHFKCQYGATSSLCCLRAIFLGSPTLRPAVRKQKNAQAPNDFDRTFSARGT